MISKVRWFHFHLSDTAQSGFAICVDSHSTRCRCICIDAIRYVHEICVRYVKWRPTIWMGKRIHDFIRSQMMGVWAGAAELKRTRFANRIRMWDHSPGGRWYLQHMYGIVTCYLPHTQRWKRESLLFEHYIDTETAVAAAAKGTKDAIWFDSHILLRSRCHDVRSCDFSISCCNCDSHGVYFQLG